ncbi:MAG: DsbC family protein [Xanthomonadales bacterium]|jgi:thiol:disulfide interchange protein DsbC|uniref:DsbC family protein n=1 Tax=Thermomonas sp. TaxID=1971895 RepID=UPI001AC28F8C|nr:DsbC family protein [Xanthomonadales bacterium]HMT38990.1 DsbC family protein [Thermomonas sp.]
MRFTLFAALCSFSLAACAQSASPTSADGSKIAVSSAAKAPVPAEPVYAAGSPEARVREVLRGLDPRIQVDHVGPAPLPGFREVIAGGQVVYVSDDGKYLLQGSLLDVAKRKDLSEAAMARLRGEVLKGIPMADRIVYSPAGTPKHRVVVLTDIECGYCRKFHTEIGEHLKRGIQVEYLAFPRAGLGSADYRKMVSVWCADDRRKALTDAKSDRAVPSKTCKTPVDMQYRAGQRMGLTGTPMILTEDGRMLGGYLPPDALEQRLRALDQDNAAASGG